METFKNASLFLPPLTFLPLFLSDSRSDVDFTLSPLPSLLLLIVSLIHVLPHSNQISRPSVSINASHLKVIGPAWHGKNFISVHLLCMHTAAKWRSETNYPKRSPLQ